MVDTPSVSWLYLTLQVYTPLALRSGITSLVVCLDVSAKAHTFLSSLTNSLQVARAISVSTLYQSNSLDFRLRRKVPARTVHVHGLRPPRGHQPSSSHLNLEPTGGNLEKHEASGDTTVQYGCALKLSDDD